MNLLWVYNLAQWAVLLLGLLSVTWWWKGEACGRAHDVRYVSLYRPIDDVFTPSTDEDMAAGLCVVGIVVMQAASRQELKTTTKRPLLLALAIGWVSLALGIHGFMPPRCGVATMYGGPYLAYGSVMATGYSVYLSVKLKQS